VTGVVLAALALLAGAPWQLVALLVLAVRLPVVFLAGVAGWTMWRRRRPADAGASAEADLLRGMAAELAAGASLRGALVAASDRAPRLDLQRAVRLAEAGFPAGDVGAALRDALPHNGRLVAPAFRLAAETGGRASGIMTTLAARADDIGTLARERRALTAQARLSAWIVGGAPLLVLGALAAAGRLGPLAADPAGRIVLVLGIAFEGAGVAAVAVMLRRAGR
jgi:tight adherence protein B